MTDKLIQPDLILLADLLEIIIRDWSNFMGIGSNEAMMNSMKVPAITLLAKLRRMSKEEP